MLVRLSSVKSLLSTRRLVVLMVSSELLLVVGIHSVMSASHSYSSLVIYGMVVALSSRIFGLVLLLSLHYKLSMVLTRS